jgi:hypothetical protein
MTDVLTEVQKELASLQAAVLLNLAMDNMMRILCHASAFAKRHVARGPIGTRLNASGGGCGR